MTTFAELTDAYNKAVHEYQRALNEKVLDLASTVNADAIGVIAKAHLYRDQPELVARYEAAHLAFESKAAEIRERETEAMDAVKASHEAALADRKAFNKEREEWKRESLSGLSGSAKADG